MTLHSNKKCILLYYVYSHEKEIAIQSVTRSRIILYVKQQIFYIKYTFQIYKYIYCKYIYFHPQIE